ncbi:hypothetical protein [Actinophytocola sp. NPDC049390]|uniref:hypothetical protein n=1 Tax=Actinophytocola sp. NPDC049390 TaxID=3363894 RepID=UPI0037BBFA8A
MAVGAVVPAVGDAMNVDSRGVGGMFGYLLGTLFFGGIGVSGLLIWRRDQKRRDTPRRGTTPPGELETSEDLAPLPAGPGLAARWLVAAPLLFLTTALPVVGQVALSAFASVSFAERFPLGDDPVPTFWQEFTDDLGGMAYAAIVPVLVLLVFTARRTMFALWPKACLWVAVWALVPGVLLGSSDSMLPNLALGAGLVWLNYLLGRLALWRLSSPVALDLVPSELEVPYAVPGSQARLRVRRDRLMLDRLGGGKNKVRKEILWAELAAARLEHVDAPLTWQASSGTSITVPPGHALRLRGADENWLLPVPEPLGEDLATFIALRAERRR